MDITTLIILSLATWRISSLFTGEDGPFKMFARIRTGKLLSCLWCFSVWAGAVITIAYAFYPAVVFWACLPFALSGLAIAADRWING